MYRDGNGYWTRPGSVVPYPFSRIWVLKYRPVGSGSDPDLFKFHGFESGSEKNTQTQTRGSGGPVFFLLFLYI